MVTRNEFEKVYSQHSEAIFRYCYFRVRDRERAKELMQEAFMKTWEYNIKNHSIDNLRAFIYRVAHNLMINERRKEGRITSLETLQEETHFEPADQDAADASTEAEAHRVFKGLKELGEEDASLIMMRYAEGLSFKEIKLVTGESENTLAVRAHRALKKLKKIYNI